MVKDECLFINFLISMMLSLFSSFTCLTLIVTSQNQYFILFLLVNFLEYLVVFFVYTNFNEKTTELLIRTKSQGAQSFRCRKGLQYPKLFEDIKQRLQVLGKFLMKFFLNFIFKLCIQVTINN